MFTALVYAIQFFFGGWYFYNGLNYFIEFTPAPPGSSPLSRELIGALEHTGLFAVVKAIELVAGAALLANRFVPLASVLAFPVSFSIAYVMLVINGGMIGTIVGVLVIAFNAIIALSRLDSFLPMLAFDDGGPRPAPMMALLRGKPPAPATRPKGLRPLTHAIAIALGVGLPVWIELATMSHFQSVVRRQEEAARALQQQAPPAANAARP
ncbi:MAG: hypothetical protein JNJ73_18410 [Hyphomonadaceae bacterium]|nr:hypothetical protein [Hyphomonadaceae bacterium]